MKDIATCWLRGRVVADALLRYTTKGTPVVVFSIANNFKTEEYDHTSYFPCVWYGNGGAKLSPHITKGTAVEIIARPQQRKYEDKDGKKHSIIEFIVEEFYFAGNKNKDAEKQEHAEPAEVVEAEEIPF